MPKIYGERVTASNEKYHYVYRITHIKTGKHYYGKRTTKRIPLDDIGIKYFSSSSDLAFKKEQKEFPENFKYKVVRILSSVEEARDLERSIHLKFSVGRNPKFYNRIIAGAEYDPLGFVTTKDDNGNIVVMSKEDFDPSVHSGVRKNVVTVSKDGINLSIHPNEFQEYISNGWSHYMLDRTIYHDPATGRNRIMTAEEAKHARCHGVNKGKIPVQDLNGNRFIVSVGDPRIGDSVFPFVNLPGYTSFRDSDGNTIRAHKDDPRVLSGELVGITKGMSIPRSQCSSTRLILLHDPEGNIVSTLDTKYERFDDFSYDGISLIWFNSAERLSRTGLFLDMTSKKLRIYDEIFPQWRLLKNFYFSVFRFRSHSQRQEFITTNEYAKYLKGK
ncbi:MAG TPA: hypothetical protein VFM18_04435 [Methanosarcina sp.]|nr:hypothetical protein [Methanosarcina sp.]